MPSALARILVASVVLAVYGVPQYAVARELATAQGTITITAARPGLSSPTCEQLMVEARDALDNHLIGRTQPMSDRDGVCHYALSVPAQSAVWIHLQPALVASARSIAADGAVPATTPHARPVSGSVGLRFTIIAPTTYFFTPGEQKMVLLTY